MPKDDNGQAYARARHDGKVIVSIERWGELQGVALLDSADARALIEDLQEAMKTVRQRRLKGITK